MEVRAKRWWKRHKMPSFERDVVSGQTIWRAVVSFNAFARVEGWRAARW